MGYDIDKSTIGEGIIAWILFNLGIIPVFIYALYLRYAKDRTYGSFGFLGKKSGITFTVLMLVEAVVIIIVTISVCKNYLI